MNSTTETHAEDQGKPDRGPAVELSSRPDFAFVTGATSGEHHRVQFLDDDPYRAQAFLAENPQAVWVQTVDECLAQLIENWDEVHLDHDLGGKTFVDINETDCGMEVIRWLCAQPRDHLRESLFYVHTHNSLAGLLMVLQMRSSGYKAEFRPFGVDPARLLADFGDGFASDEPPQTSSRPGFRFSTMLKRLLTIFRCGWLL